VPCYVPAVSPARVCLSPYGPRDTQRVSQKGEKTLKTWQKRQKCVYLRENE